MTLPIVGYVQQVEVVVGGNLPRAGYVQPVENSGGGGGLITGSGVAGQVTFWTGTHTVSGSASFLWDDANLRETVGRAWLYTPGAPGTGNLFLGESAGNLTLSSGNNTGVGYQALVAITSGDNNTALGLVSLGHLTTGTKNTGLGQGTLARTVGAQKNTAAGNDSMFFNISGNFNTAVGTDSLANQTTGDSNVAIGMQALYLNNGGGSNTASGSTVAQNNVTGNFLCAYGAGALNGNTTGSYNVGVGYNCGQVNQTGSHNVFIGDAADAASAALSNAIAIGASAVVDASNTMVLGNGSVALVRAGAHNSTDLGSTGVRWKDGWFQGNVTIAGKLTVSGAIDPTSVSLSGGTALYFESNDGSTASVSGAAAGRIRYNNTTGTWQISAQGGAYVSIATGSGMAIGNPVVGGTNRSCLYVDGSTNLGNDANYNFNPALNIPANVTVGFDGGIAPIFNIGVDYATVANALLADGRTYGMVNLRTTVNNVCLLLGEYRGTGVGGFSFRSRRSRTSPLTTLDGDLLGSYYAEGWDTDTPQQVHAAAGMYVVQQGAGGSGYVPGKIVWQTSPQGAGGPADRMSLDRNGLLTIITGPLGFGTSVNGVINSVNGTYVNVNSTSLNNGAEFTVRSATATDSGGSTLFKVQDAFVSGGPRILVPTGVGAVFQGTMTITGPVTWDASVNGTVNSPNGIYYDVNSTHLNNGAEFAISSGGSYLLRAQDSFVSGGPRVLLPAGINLVLNGGAGLGSGAGVMSIANAGTAPTTNPSGGGILYAEGGAGKWRGSGGTVTTFGPAEPHCEVCGSDYGHEWENKKWGRLQFCVNCLADHVAKDFGEQLPRWIKREPVAA